MGEQTWSHIFHFINFFLVQRWDKTRQSTRAIFYHHRYRSLPIIHHQMKGVLCLLYCRLIQYSTWQQLGILKINIPCTALESMPLSTNWRSAKCKLSGLRNFFPASTEAAVHPHKIFLGHYILLLKSQNFGVCLSEERQCCLWWRSHFWSTQVPQEEHLTGPCQRYFGSESFFVSLF